MTETCASCRYWVESDMHEGVGACRRFPPGPQMTIYLGRKTYEGTQHQYQIEADYAETCGDWWCGEWEGKPDGDASSPASSPGGNTPEPGCPD